MNLLIVVDMQKDFISGALGTKEAVAIVPRVAEKIAQAKKAGKTVIFTRDTHQENYLQTQEGKNLPVEHCIRGTNGWELRPEIQDLISAEVMDKPTFGSRKLAEFLKKQETEIDSITLVGLCTDICVISNAMVLKAFMPEIPIKVDASCCAGVTPESHENALKAMEACQIQIDR